MNTQYCVFIPFQIFLVCWSTVQKGKNTLCVFLSFCVLMIFFVCSSTPPIIFSLTEKHMQVAADNAEQAFATHLGLLYRLDVVECSILDL